MTAPLPHTQSPADPSLGPPPGRDLPVNDPPPGDGAQPPVQDPPVVPQPDEAVDADWPDDLNPEAHESAV